MSDRSVVTEEEQLLANVKQSLAARSGDADRQTRHYDADLIALARDRLT